MTAIVTAPAQANQPKYDTTAAIERVETYTSSVTLSAGDTIALTSLKIPHGATIVDARIAGRVPGGTALVNLGTSGSAALLGSATLSDTYKILSFVSTALPYTVSVSDDAAQRYISLIATLATGTVSGTAGSAISFMVRYVMSP